MSKIRRVQATNPHTGYVVDRQSKTKVYTHALVLHHPAHEAFTIPAGTYTVPKKRIRGRNIPAWQTTHSVDRTTPARPESWSVRSFHTSFVAADKAGRSEVSGSQSSVDQNRAIYGAHVANDVPWSDRFEIVEVEVLDEGFNA